MRLSTNAISHEASGLANFLIERSVRNPVLGNRFHWYLMVEVALEDKQVAKVYGKVWYEYMEKLKKVSSLFFPVHISFGNLESLSRLRMAQHERRCCVGKVN